MDCTYFDFRSSSIWELDFSDFPYRLGEFALKDISFLIPSELVNASRLFSEISKLVKIFHSLRTISCELPYILRDGKNPRQ